MKDISQNITVKERCKGARGEEVRAVREGEVEAVESEKRKDKEEWRAREWKGK